MISLGDLAAGLVLLGLTLGACAWATRSLVRGRWSGPEGVLACGVVFSAAVVFAHLIPGALGILDEWTALLTALLLAAVATRARKEVRVPRAHGESIGVLAGGALLAVAACVAAFARETAGTVVTGLDATTFHIPLVARFMQEGSVWGLHQWVPDYSNATYPAHGNLLQLAVVSPFEHAFLSTLVAVPYMALAGVAAYALGRALGATAKASALAAAALLAVPDMADVSLATAVTDAPTVAFLGAAMVFGLRERREDLLLAGLALGMAVGTKWYGLSYAAVLVLVWLLAHRRLRGLPAAVGVAALSGGFWLVRNWVETGNPLFPVRSPLFDAPTDLVREQGGFTIFNYAFDPGVWEAHLGPAFEQGFAWTGAAILAAALAAAAIERRGRVLVVTAAGVGMALVYFATPYSAFGPEGAPILAGASTRYGLPALLALAGPAAWLLSRSWVLRLVVLVAVAEALRHGFPGLSAAELLVGAALALGAAAIVRLPRAAAVAACAAVALAGAEILRQRANDATYDSYSAVYGPLQEGRTTVGLLGQWPLSDVAPVLPAFGERLRNDVRYVGEFRDGFLRRERVQDFGDRRYLVAACIACREVQQALRAGYAIVVRDDPFVLLRR